MTKKKLYFAMIVLSVSAVIWAAGFSSNPFFGNLTTLANGYYLEISAGSPLDQNWSNTSLLQADDDWTQVVAIEGFSGNGLATVLGADPRTITADNPNNPLDVKVNQTNPATALIDGVAEFEIADPTIALRASDTATAPNIVIHLNTTIGCVGKGLVVDYNVRDIDNSERNAPTQVVAQYRIGGSGNYTTVSSSYIADATTGPNQATLATPRRLTLPLTASGQPMVDVRILTTNSALADEWIGIDDIHVDCIHPTAATAFVNGRVLDGYGNGVAKALVTIMNMQTGETKSVMTSPFGWYNFEDLEVNAFYTVSVRHKRYEFGKNSQFFQLQNDMEDVNFIGN
jgi:hypothetical protein